MKNNALNRALFILLSSLFTIVFNSEILAASDSVTIVDLDGSRIVETVKKDAINDGVDEIINIAKTDDRLSVAVMNKTPESLPAPAPTQTLPKNNIAFNWGIQELNKAESTSVDSGNGVAKIGKLIYGHNYTAFGKITKLKIGDTFKVTVDGVVTTYKIVANPIDNTEGVILDKVGAAALSYPNDKRYDLIDMNALIKYGMGHSLVLLTCYGSNSRYVMTADAI